MPRYDIYELRPSEYKMVEDKDIRATLGHVLACRETLAAAKQYRDELHSEQPNRILGIRPCPVKW